MKPADLHATGQLRAVLEAAKSFGLPEQERCEAVIEAWCCEHSAIEEDAVDDLAAALARRILERERAVVRSRQAA
jgi:hypothetical protein